MAEATVDFRFLQARTTEDLAHCALSAGLDLEIRTNDREPWASGLVNCLRRDRLRLGFTRTDRILARPSEALPKE